MDEALSPEVISVDGLIGGWDSFLLDAYGVLVNAEGALPGAREFLERVNEEGKEFWVATNDASRLPETTQKRFASLDLPVETEQVLTSGGLIVGYFEKNDLAGANCVVLGTTDSAEYVRQAGGKVVPADPNGDVDVLVVADDDGFSFLEITEAALAMVLRSLERGKTPTILLPNPDIIYPKNKNEYGFTAGAVALLIETALQRCLGNDAPGFVGLGKPNPGLFEEGLKRASGRIVMVGDQMETDILGARRLGMDAVLIATGVSTWSPGVSAKLSPTHLLSSFV